MIDTDKMQRVPMSGKAREFMVEIFSRFEERGDKVSPEELHILTINLIANLLHNCIVSTVPGKRVERCRLLKLMINEISDDADFFMTSPYFFLPPEQEGLLNSIDRKLSNEHE